MSHEIAAPLSKETFEAFQEAMQAYNRTYEEYMGLNAAKLGPDHLERLKRETNFLSPERIAELFEYVQKGMRFISPLPLLTGYWYWDIDSAKPFHASCKEFVQRPEIHLCHALRFTSIVGFVYPDARLLFCGSNRILNFFFESRSTYYNFTEIAAVLNEMGVDDNIAAQEFLDRAIVPEDENLAYFHRKPELLLNQLVQTRGNSFHCFERRKAVLSIIEKYPEIPATLLQTLWEDALGDGKTLRLEIQRALENRPNVLSNILDALKSSKAGTRSTAAQWLARLRKPEAVKPLQEALKKEKIDSARIDLMKALVACGVSLDELLDRDELLKEAEKVLKKAKFDEAPPKSLSWFPFDKLPGLHWDDGTAVDPKIVQYWLVQAVKMKTPEPNPLIVFYGQQMNRSECEAVARFLLENWIAEDVRTGTEEEAQKKAQDFCTVVFGGQASPQDYQILLERMRKEPIGSANDSKGILGLVAAWGDATLPAIMEKYVRDWYGNRVHQSRALVVALGGMENTAAIQALLSISRKMKTKSIREEAENAIKNLAERKNWTLDQLADRTAPTAGLDEHREIVFDLGVRKITARWATEPKLFPYDESGKQLKTFPGQLKSDDETRYAEAKKAFQAANKLLKTTVTQQTDRLYEAMCAGRTWAFDEWTTYILRHPVLGRLACGLVWGVFERESEEPSKIFRPMEDGSLTDVDDNPLKLAETDRIRIAHSLDLTPEQIVDWTRHLNDYEVKPLFPQFGRSPYRLPDEKKRETKIADFYGSKVMAFNLRSLATKHGFVRGETGDGGWFYEYLKPIPGLELSVVVEFSGNGLPEENNEVELYHLAFRTKTNRELPMEKVPPVLLSEMVRTLEALKK